MPVSARRIARLMDHIDHIRPGDVIGYSGTILNGGLINLCTYGIPARGICHVGIVAEFDPSDPPAHMPGPTLLTDHPVSLLFESLDDCDTVCFFRGTRGPGVQAHRLVEQIVPEKGMVWHYPLARPLRALQSRRLLVGLMSHLGKGYDRIGGFRSAGKGFSWLESKLRHADLSALFCSELCVAVLNQLNLFGTANVSSWSPNKFVRAGVKRGLFKQPVRIW